ncbi:MAG: helix-hairpin-helix domain-containing protein [Flavobacteriales bacterium]|nr:helix-hairpin-helix domain-containing protein [Flavobacteriales bacterium]
MKFNKKQRIGLIVLISVIISIQLVILNFDDFQSSTISKERKAQLEYYNSVIDSLKENSSQTANEYFRFNPNKLSYNSWSYFGLSTSQLYSLDSFRATGEFFSKLQVKEVLRLNDSVYNVIDTLMYFPKVYASNSYSKKQKINYSDFNPNEYTKEDWIRMGFSEKQSEVIFNYINVRGGLKSKDELKDIFVINTEKYKELEPFVNIPEVVGNIQKLEVTLNTANVEDFKTINGIGEVYSKIIVDYRNSLGGFKHYYQLKEIKILDSTLYEIIKKEFPLNKDFTVRKISVNTATFEELKNHPYISWRLANSIVDFRTNFRDFNSLEELKNIEVISDAYFDKIELYLTLD